MKPGSAPRPARRGPALALVLLSAATVFSLLESYAQADKKVMTDNPTTVATATTVVWSVAGLTLVLIVITALRRRQPRVLLALLALAVPVLAGATLSTVRIQDNSGYLDTLARARQARADLITAAAQACHDHPVPGAAAASDTASDGSPIGRKVWPLVVFDEQGETFGLQEITDRGWFPASLAQLRAVVCLEAEQKHVGYCNYTSGKSYAVTHYFRPARIVEASTGRSIFSGDLAGSVPQCEPHIYGEHGDETGDPVDGSAVYYDLEEQMTPRATTTP
jgi:hypothetical protein